VRLLLLLTMHSAKRGRARGTFLLLLLTSANIRGGFSGAATDTPNTRQQTTS
jgi:hypothetical protein